MERNNCGEGLLSRYRPEITNLLSTVHVFYIISLKIKSDHRSFRLLNSIIISKFIPSHQARGTLPALELFVHFAALKLIDLIFPASIKNFGLKKYQIVQSTKF